MQLMGVEVAIGCFCSLMSSYRKLLILLRARKKSKNFNVPCYTQPMDQEGSLFWYTHWKWKVLFEFSVECEDWSGQLVSPASAPSGTCLSAVCHKNPLTSSQFSPQLQNPLKCCSADRQKCCKNANFLVLKGKMPRNAFQNVSLLHKDLR